MDDVARVIRVVEYVGPRSRIERVIDRSAHGEKWEVGNGLTIRSSTIQGSSLEKITEEITAHFVSTRQEQS